MSAKKLGLCIAHLVAALWLTPSIACPWSGIDHEVSRDESGIWNPKIYRGLVISLTAFQVGGALWEGSDTRFARTMWQGIDSQLLADVSAEALKRSFNRSRPITSNNDACVWFSSQGNHSFPSGESTNAMALVFPYVLEYRSEEPLVYGLLLLPAYVGAARVKAQAHWQSDVLAGWALGGIAGAYAHSRDVPILVEILPRSITIGLRQRF